MFEKKTLPLQSIWRFRSSVGLEQQPSKLWVLGSNPNGITKSLSNNAKNRILSKKEYGCKSLIIKYLSPYFSFRGVLGARNRLTLTGRRLVYDIKRRNSLKTDLLTQTTMINYSVKKARHYKYLQISLYLCKHIVQE